MAMAMASTAIAIPKIVAGHLVRVSCRNKDRDTHYPYKVVEITPPPRSLGVRCFPSNIHCGESVTIEGQTYTVSSVTHRYQLRKGKYEPSEKRLDSLWGECHDRRPNLRGFSSSPSLPAPQG